MGLFRSTSQQPSLRPISLWLRLKRIFRNGLIKGFQWSHLDRLYTLINEYLSATRRPIDPDKTKPKWEKWEYGFRVKPKPELEQAEKEIFGPEKKEPKPKFWQLRKKKEAKKSAALKAELEADPEVTNGPQILLPGHTLPPGPHYSHPPTKPPAEPDKPDYKLY